MEPGGYSDTLRALGRLVEQADASGVRIGDASNRWMVEWNQTDFPRVTLDGGDLDALRTVARLHRGIEAGRPRADVSRSLRTIGALLDQMRATGFEIAEVPDGYEVTAHVGNQRGQITLRADDLDRLARNQSDEVSGPLSDLL